jgi:hypothetical protein
VPFLSQENSTRNTLLLASVLIIGAASNHLQTDRSPTGSTTSSLSCGRRWTLSKPRVGMSPRSSSHLVSPTSRRKLIAKRMKLITKRRWIRWLHRGDNSSNHRRGCRHDSTYRRAGPQNNLAKYAVASTELRRDKGQTVTSSMFMHTLIPRLSVRAAFADRLSRCLADHPRNPS